MVTVDNPFVRVLEAFGAAVVDIVGEGNYGTDYNMAESATKYARLIQLGMSTTTADLAGNEVATNLSFQTEAFASGTRAMTDAYEIDQAIHSCMVNLGFRCSYGPEPKNNIDSRITRIVRRYNRIYTGQLLGE